MKKILTLVLIVIAATNAFAGSRDLDSLKTQLQITKNDTLKGGIYKQIAAQYLQYDTIKHSGVKRYYQDEALNYTMLALHNFSYYEDILGMRTCFDYLSKVYQSQGKFSQAKWFLLQSNKISRDQKDTVGIISSLVRLSGVKMANKDYKLSMRDLNEALTLSAKTKSPKLEALVQQNYAFLYNRMGEPEKGDIASKRAAELYENIKNDEELKAMAFQSPVKETVKGKKAIVANKKKSISKTYAKKASKLNANAVKGLASL
ncbi:hypothetical protein [Mucilaginibacter sp.]|uniref:hypothetical protein n=1 Tax=Mucilaginibacter sp. TaxID=1882438 RepID=UPI0035BBD035